MRSLSLSGWLVPTQGSAILGRASALVAVRVSFVLLLRVFVLIFCTVSVPFDGGLANTGESRGCGC